MKKRVSILVLYMLFSGLSYAEGNSLSLLETSLISVLGDHPDNPRIKDIRLGPKNFILEFRTYMKLDGEMAKFGVNRQLIEIFSSLSSAKNLENIEKFRIEAHQKFYDRQTEELVMLIVLPKAQLKETDWNSITADQLLELAKTKGQLEVHSRFSK